jgi:proton-translocating NADH-quinone oxidoreductase chain M
MAESFYLMAAVFLPLLLSPVAFILGRKKGIQLVTWFSFGVLAISTGLLLAPILSIDEGDNRIYEESFSWSQFGNFGLRLDGLSIPFAIIIYILSTVLALYSKPYMLHKIQEDADAQFGGGGHSDHGKWQSDLGGGSEQAPLSGSSTSSSSSSSTTARTNIETTSQATTLIEKESYIRTQTGLYFALYLTFSMGMLGTVLATNLIEFYVFFELMLVPAFFMVAFYGYGARRRIALMFFFWTHVGAVILLLGLLAMGFFAGGFDYVTVKENAGEIPVEWMSLIIFSLVIGLGVKLAAFGLHIWLPYAHAEAPTPISALLSPAMIGIGAYGLLRLWMDLLTGDYTHYSIYINLWGLVTMIYGGAMALMQDDIKRLLAYSSISQMGYVLFGLGSESVLGITGATLIYVSHGLGKALLFMMAGSIILQTGTRSMSQLGGLAGKMPYTAVLAMIGGLTIIGIPPTSGFMSEWITFSGALQSGVEHAETIRVVAFALGIVATLLTAGYILWMYKRIFFGKIPARLIQIKDSNRYITATMAFLAAMTLIVGVYPDIFLVPITGYITNLFSGTPEVLQLPTTTEGGGRSAGEVTNMTSSSLSSSPPPTTAPPSLHNVNGNNGEANLPNVLLNKNPNQVNMEQQQQQSLLSNYYHPNTGSKGGLYRAEVYDVGGGVGGIAKVGGVVGGGLA